MHQGIIEHHETDDFGTPTGGSSFAPGIQVYWQNGPVVPGEPRGAFVSQLIEIALRRLDHLRGKFPNEHTATAIHHLELALAALNERTEERKARGVEGTHQA